MRSPFYYFRKNQKALLAVFGVALMFAFTLTVGGFTMVDIFMSSSQNGQDREDVVVTFKGGSLSEGDLSIERWRHNAVRAYLRAVVDETLKKKGTPGMRRLRASGDSDAELLHTVLMARKAEELGIVITDKAITDSLVELSDGKITLDGLDDIREKRFGRDLPFSTLLETLRQELAARSVEEFVLSGLATRSETRGEQYAIEPSRAWEYFGHLNRELTAEILPLKVEDYIKDAPEPTEEQIAELFEEHKHDYAFPNQPEPGFKQRDRVALAYVKADYQQFLAEEKTKVTDDEIEKYYNDHINDFRKPELPPERDTTTTEPEDPADEASEESDAEGETEETDSEADTATETEGEPPATEESATGEDADATSPPGDDTAPNTPVEKQSTDAEPAPDASDADTDAADDASGPSAEDTSDSESAAPAPGEGAQFRGPNGAAADIHYVAYLADPADDEANAETAGGETLDEPAGTATAVEAAPSSDGATSADDEKETPQPPKDPAGEAAVEANTTDPATADSTDEPAAAEATDAPEPDSGTEEEATDDAAVEQPAQGETDAAASEPKVEYRSLDEVRDEIREILAAKPAQERLNDALSAVLEKTNRYAQERGLWEVEKADDENLLEPNPPNLKPMLDEYGLTSGDTQNVDMFEIADHEIGKAQHTLYVSPRPNVPPQPKTVTLVSEAFAEGLPLYQPKRFPPTVSDTRFSTGTANEQYVFWKTAEKPSHVPELKDIREEVIQAWKRREAVKLAQQAADEYVQQAREGGLSLVAKFGKDKVTETATFSFYDRLSRMLASMGRGRLQISSVDGVEQPGRKFMRTVLDHEAGDVFTALNEPESHVYVVRIKTDQPSKETLRDNFKASLTVGPEPGLPYEVQLLAQQDVGELLVEWIEDFENELDVEWKRDPQPGSRDAI